MTDNNAPVPQQKIEMSINPPHSINQAYHTSAFRSSHIESGGNLADEDAL